MYSHSHLMSWEQLLHPASVQTARMLVRPSSRRRPRLQTNSNDDPSVPSPVSFVVRMVGWLPFGGFEHTGRVTRGKGKLGYRVFVRRRVEGECCIHSAHSAIGRKYIRYWELPHS